MSSTAHPPDPATDPGADSAADFADLDDPAGARLEAALFERFGYRSFRGCQRAVIDAAVRGEDTLIVMPTGAGKSLCYQLPGVVRAGCTLVISPLIALMEDQVAALQAAGFSAERIHSGRSREQSRAVCRQYLDGALDLLYVAPERLRIPRFTDFLTRRTPALIAVDEAHCISQWGHDFRPDYRLLGETLQRFSGTPLMALTATATERVQDDIAAQLGRDFRRFVHGFRRDNLAIEAVELSSTRRVDALIRALDDTERRPAIVYVPTRKLSEEVSAALCAGGIDAVAYHAGMSAEAREAAQGAFSDGRTEVVCATSAFGMGIDKANVRTVVHLALPGSLESYYQEIGRAGRDGAPSRALLFHGYADLRLLEHRLTRSYPAPGLLRQVHGALPAEFTPVADLRAHLPLKDEVWDGVVKQLVIHGAAEHDAYAGEIRRGPNRAWAQSYAAQRALREAEIEAMRGFADGGRCRMCAVVAHFGDHQNAIAPCGLCDVCAPSACVVRRFCPPDDAQRQALSEILRVATGLAKGRVFSEVKHRALRDRKAFERAVDALCRAGFLDGQPAQFDKDGESIAYVRLTTTPDGERATLDDLSTVALEVEQPAGATRQRSRSRPRGDLPPVDEALAERLRTWRRERSVSLGVPAYRVLTNRTLDEIACTKPQNAGALSACHGVGPKFLEQFADEVLALVAADPAPTRA